jgi:hypothetical protein
VPLLVLVIFDFTAARLESRQFSAIHPVFLQDLIAMYIQSSG